MSLSSFEDLLAAVAGDVVAVRCRSRMQPAGGIGEKVFPPTYSGEQGETKYAHETREIDGKEVVTVLLDSVASQANRAELALLNAYERNAVRFPVPQIDFSGTDVIREFERLTVLETPHRVADAIFRDSLLGDQLFRDSDIGKSITDATPRNATALYRYAPSSLLFGVWDSTGPKGGLGSKFQRSYVSEIVGHNAKFGMSVGSRLDPLGIGLLPSDNPIYNHEDSNEIWTLDEDRAEREKNKPKLVDRGSGEGKAGQPSKINHGNVTPTRDRLSGGVTIEYAEQTSVLSIATFRKLRFDGYSTEQEDAARCSLTALGLVAMRYVWNSDFDLRSRCLLIPESKPNVELLRRDGAVESDVIDFSSDTADELLREAIKFANEKGIGWEEEEIVLTPAPKLIELMQISQSVRKAERVGSD